MADVQKSELLAAYKVDTDDNQVRHLLYLTWWNRREQAMEYKTMTVTPERWQQAVEKGDLS